MEKLFPLKLNSDYYKYPENFRPFPFLKINHNKYLNEQKKLYLMF